MPPPADTFLDAQLALADLRLRVLNRETITPDEYRRVMQALRGDRDNAARASATHRRAASKIMGTGTGKPATLALDQLFPQARAERAAPLPGTPRDYNAQEEDDDPHPNLKDYNPYGSSTPTDEGE